MKRLILFDIDGTLLVTRGATSRCILRACRSIFGEQFRWGGVEVGTLDSQIFLQLAGYNGIVDAERYQLSYRDTYLKGLAAELEAVRADVTVLPGVPHLLAELRERAGVVCGLVTGNYEKAAMLKLAAANIDASQFRVSAFAEAAADRPGLVRSAVAEYKHCVGGLIEGEAVIVIGDTPNDVACAKANGCFAFAVATGFYSVEELASAGADRVVNDLSSPAPVLELLGAKEQARIRR